MSPPQIPLIPSLTCRTGGRARRAERSGWTAGRGPPPGACGAGGESCSGTTPSSTCASTELLFLEKKRMTALPGLPAATCSSHGRPRPSDGASQTAMHTSLQPPFRCVVYVVASRALVAQSVPPPHWYQRQPQRHLAFRQRAAATTTDKPPPVNLMIQVVAPRHDEGAHSPARSRGQGSPR